MNEPAGGKENIRRIENTGRSSIGTGTTSLLMIFTVLCFATLALLSLSTAFSNRNVQQRSFQQLQAQAVAEGEAAAGLAALDAALREADPATFNEVAMGLGWAPTGEENQYSYVLPCGEGHELMTTITLTPAQDDAFYRLNGQTTRYTGEWEPVANDQLWEG